MSVLSNILRQGIGKGMSILNQVTLMKPELWKVRYVFCEQNLKVFNKLRSLFQSTYNIHMELGATQLYTCTLNISCKKGNN